MISDFTKKRPWLLPIALVGIVLSAVILAYGQQSPLKSVGVGHDVRFPERYDPPLQTLRTLTTMKEARPEGKLLIGKQLRIESFRTNGDPEMVIAAPDCTLDSVSKNAYSSGPIQIQSADGKMRVDGVGFVWNTVTNGGATIGLAISNKVHTILNKDLIKETNAVPAISSTNNAAPTTNDLLHVYSDRLNFDRQANLITYTGNVRVEDVQLNLLCDVMTVQMKSATNGGIDKIVADQNVIIIDKAHGGRTTGDQAVYSMRDGKQVVELTGNPHFQDGLREGTAKLFVFERLPDNKGSLLHAVGDAFLKIPPGSIGKEGVFLTESSAPTNAPVATNRFVELYADSMTFRLPPTNGPVQAITAEKNVLIVDRERKSQAIGSHAFYDSNTGYLELTTNALWQADQRLAKGEILIFNQKEGSFEARTNAYLKLPASALGRSTPFQSSNSQAAATNQFIEILCKSYEAKNELLTFHDHVQAAFAQGDAILGTLECENLKVGYTTNQVKGATGTKTIYDLKSIVAEKHVYAHQLPFKSPRGRTIEKEMKCEVLTMLMRPGTNLVQRVIADQNVLGTQTEIDTNGFPTRTTLASEIVTADFFPHTNQVETAVADRNVVITRDSKRSELRTDSTIARGARGIYTGTNDMMALTGHPSVTTTNGILIGEPILLDRRRNKVLVPNYNLKFTVKTNAASIKAASAAGAK